MTQKTLIATAAGLAFVFTKAVVSEDQESLNMTKKSMASYELTVQPPNKTTKLTSVDSNGTTCSATTDVVYSLQSAEEVAIKSIHIGQCDDGTERLAERELTKLFEDNENVKILDQIGAQYTITTEASSGNVTGSLTSKNSNGSTCTTTINTRYDPQTGQVNLDSMNMFQLGNCGGQVIGMVM